MAMLIIVVISVLVNIIFGYAIYNLLRKFEQYEDIVENLQNHIIEQDQFIENFSNSLTLIKDRLEQIDIRGSFSSDDEVGMVFTTIKGLVSKLQVYNANGE